MLLSSSLHLGLGFCCATLTFYKLLEFILMDISVGLLGIHTVKSFCGYIYIEK